MKEVEFFTPGARLALELECLLMDTRDAAVQSRWWDSAHEALEQWRQAIRDMEASIDAVQPQASTTLEEAASHARVCSGLAEQHKSDPVLFAALTDAAAIIRDLRSAVARVQARIGALMLEYCPDEMTPEQVAEWARHQRPANPTIVHCDNCGCDWVDNGINPIGCPYCKTTSGSINTSANRVRQA